MPVFQCAKGGTDGGLGQVQRFCCARHMLALGHGNKNTKLFEGHSRSIEIGDD